MPVVDGHVLAECLFPLALASIFLLGMSSLDARSPLHWQVSSHWCWQGCSRRYWHVCSRWRWQAVPVGAGKTVPIGMYSMKPILIQRSVLACLIQAHLMLVQRSFPTRSPPNACILTPNLLGAHSSLAQRAFSAPLIQAHPMLAQRSMHPCNSSAHY
jgi:hypothetical protein